MNTRKVVLSSIVSLGLFTGGLLIGQNVNPQKHPNLAAAQEHISKAISRIDQAQSANEFDMKGHAQRAKELLKTAYNELDAAASAANRR